MTIFVDSITEDDRGVFLVTTQGSEHTWVITDDGVRVTRENKDGNSHWSMRGLEKWSYRAEPKVWPEVDSMFMNIVNGGTGDVPWTRSSRIRSIERVI